MTEKEECWDYSDSDLPLSWEKFVEQFSKCSWAEKTKIFRGHANGTYLLEPTLRRICKREKLEEDQIHHVERRIFEEFKYLGHNYYNVDLTGGGKAWPRHFEALGWIQHYGGPTRCLDFSWSPFVAAFFAMEEPPVNNDGIDPSIIEITVKPKEELLGWENLELTWKQWKGVFQPDAYKTDEKYKPPRNDYFWAIPRKLHDRFARQQGVLFVPVNIKESTHTLLLKQDIKRYRLSLKDRLNFLSGLRQMNITRESLFEGTDAWAKSLQRCAWEIKKGTVI